MNRIYGLMPVLEILRSRKRQLQKIYIATGANPGRIEELTEIAKRMGISVERCNRRVLDEMAPGANHQGVIAIAGPGAPGDVYTPAETILDALPEMPLLVLLDGIEDPHNLGAVIRTCECAGADGVFIPEHRAAGLNDTVAKTSAGAVAYLPIARVANFVRLIEDLKERGIWVIGVEGGAAQNYADFDLKVPLALVLGSEGKGIRRLVRENCDALVSIPMMGQIDSLNVSVAAGVVVFEALRQRRNH